MVKYRAPLRRGVPDDRRDPAGRYSPRYPSEAFLDAVRDAAPAGTNEVADAVGCTTQNAAHRLRQLEADGAVSGKKVGGSMVWTRAGGRGREADASVTDGVTADGGAGCASPHSEAASAFAERVDRRLGDDVVRVVLFGSVARGEPGAASDVDVLVVVASGADYAAVDDQLLAVAYDVQLDYGVVVEVHSLAEGEFAARLERDDPFVRAVLGADA